MNAFVKSSGFVTVIIFCSVTAFGQTQPRQESWSRTACVKVRDGKAAEFAAYLQEAVKLAKVRVESGQMIRYIIAQSVSPQGRTAVCDYRLGSYYTGFPPEPPTPEQTEADMKTAGIKMTPTAMNAKRDELSYLVSMETWHWLDRTGAPTSKGQYARVNLNKIAAGRLQEWVQNEISGWKPLAEEAAKQMGTAWVVGTLVMPGGSAQPYNSSTIDVFPNWAAVQTGIPSRKLWNQVHPQSDLASFTAHVATMADRPRVDMVKLIEVVSKQ
jgi:hypothetical protein